MKKKLELKKTVVAFLSDPQKNQGMVGQQAPWVTEPPCIHSSLCTGKHDDTCECTVCGLDCMSGMGI